MHFLVSYTFPAGPLFKPPHLQPALDAALMPYPHVKVFDHTYVVRVYSIDQYSRASQELIRISSENPSAIQLILSPVMTGSGYTGWLPSNLWPLLNGLVGP